MATRKKTSSAKKASWVPELTTKDGVSLTLHALRWRRVGRGTLGKGTWKQTRLHYLRRLKLQLGTRGVVADSTLSKRTPPAECVEAELVSTWAPTDETAGEGEVSMSRLTVLFFQKDGQDPLATLEGLVAKLNWAEHARVIAA